jgi:hypothetical protein
MRKLCVFTAVALVLAVAACANTSELNARDSGPKFILKRVYVDGDRRFCYYARGYYVEGAETKVTTLSADQYCPTAL